MHPVLLFATGLVTGIVGVRALKNSKGKESLTALSHKTRHGLDQAKSGLRDATVSGLTAIEKSSANLRGKLTPAADAAEPETGPKP
ncbi:hypothetical protein [Magnetospirillum fulvum]|jgi:hypothetical protein|uniref:Uncharacterized protein n=1 Tax=Magnetospirillum fulvum MGU-K5 TaxID=1316936 RepID=S9TDV4_MAGFU|nr:hypothetical protein [Magnetospirillum fulvum]EPY00431.1 hypothetical protein K678_16080 [Magnetospirillum fulvum MGU-K5]